MWGGGGRKRLQSAEEERGRGEVGEVGVITFGRTQCVQSFTNTTQALLLLASTNIFFSVGLPLATRSSSGTVEIALADWVCACTSV